VRTRAHAEEDVRGREAQVREHLGGHARVVVLARVHDPLVDAATRLERADDRRHLHEVGASPYDLENLHHSAENHSRRAATAVSDW
jgi:hypothetical protein